MLHLLLTAALLSTTAAVSSRTVVRSDFFVDSDTGIRIFVREVATRDSASYGKPIVLVHGARVPGIASFDLPVPGGSLAADLAERGWDVFVMDVRGYGRSTRPAAMEEPANRNATLVRSDEAAHDIGSVVEAICKRRRVDRVAIFGWATGGQWAGYYASLHPKKVGALILLNSLYKGASPQPMIGRGSDLEDPAHPGRFNQTSCGAYRLNDAASLLRVWDRSIPMENKSEWRDPTVAQAYVDAALASDPTSQSRRPPSFRSPCGAMEDSFYLAIGRQLWDASHITAPTLILASERDFWSRPEDREHLQADLAHSTKVRTVVLPNATHFVFLDRANRGRNLMLSEIDHFLKNCGFVTAPEAR